jgi:peptide/nickel transport system substrate-binding protein
MTDIVGSTEHAAELGDSAWRELVQQHHGLVRAALRRHGGREIDTAGDGFFAIFDAPAAAVECALEIASGVKGLGLEIRAGLHVGEVEQLGRKVGGLAVPIAARIMALAGAGEVLVSATVRELVTGAGLRFEDRGTHVLKGVPEEWRVYRALPVQAGEVSAGDAASRRSAAVRRARARPIWQRHPRAVGIGTLTLTGVVAASGLLFWQPWLPPALAAIEDDAVGVIDGARGVITDSIKVDQRPGGIVVAGEAAWVTNTGSNTVSLIDAATQVVRRVIDVGAAPLGIAAVGESIWVANSGARTLTRINAATSRVVDTVTVGNGPVAVAGGGGALWVANLSDSTVMRLDPASGAVVATIPVAAGPAALAADATSVWVLSADAASVTHLDGSTGAALGPPIALSNRPSAMALGAGSLWIAGADGSLTRVDPSNQRVVAAVDVGGSIAALAVTDSDVWIADRTGYVVRLDAADPTRQPTKVATTSSPEALATAGGQVWVAARAPTASHRGGTLRVVFRYMPEADPQSFSPNHLTELTGDALVGYRRVAGAAGSVLLPNLATAIPRPANAGLTYTFQLRPDIVYSTGEPVRASDFRRGIERSFQVANPVFGDAEGPFLFGALAGAESCATEDSSPVERCDLSGAIVTDDGNRAVTFNLSRADPSFLGNLATPAAMPIPDSVPMNEVVVGPVPGSGPYLIASYGEHETRLVRNPNFRPWDPEVRPDGFVDEIVWTVVEDAEEAVAMVERGEADFLPLRAGLRVSNELFSRLRLQYPGQLHFGTSSVTAVVFNAAKPPFDSPAARQALAMAIDRAHIADLHGGALATAVTCQVLPPGFPGYVPYCPYTVDPDEAGQWREPDPSSARTLVQSSGTTGASVVVGPVRARQADTRDHLVEVLRELGYEAAANTETEDGQVFAAYESGDFQVQVWEFTTGSVSPADFLQNFTCERGSAYGYCDAEYDALVAKALDLQLSDPASAASLWTQADHRVVDLAYWAPLYNEGTDFTSSRVGNYQFHPAYSGLIDQLWVQ